MNAKATPSASKAAKTPETIEMGTGNVFADLGLPDADERHLRVQLATRLNDLLQAEGLTQAAAAKHLGIAQPHVSELKNYKLTRFLPCCSNGRLRGSKKSKQKLFLHF